MVAYGIWAFFQYSSCHYFSDDVSLELVYVDGILMIVIVMIPKSFQIYNSL